MAKVIFTNGYLSVNAVDLSDHVVSIGMPESVQMEDVTAMGAAGKQKLPGLRDEKITITFRQDYAASKVDQTVAPLYTGGSSFTVEVRPVNAAASTTNPKWSGTCYVSEYQPINGEVGSVLNADTTFEVDGVLTRATS